MKLKNEKQVSKRINDLSKENPLVSIIVITYNSSKYVLDTLESTYEQTYKNIELIITDDGSKDNTIELCENWIEINKGRFKKTKLITVNKNTGVTANCNRGFNQSNGSWIKLIAGDDVLHENCIQAYINFIKEKQLKPSFIFSNQVFFYNSISNITKSFDITKLVTMNKSNQYIDFLCERPTIAPSCFVHADTLKSLGGYDVEYRNIEDLPLYLKALKAGNEFNLLAKNLVYYRVSEVSISNDSKNLNEGSKLFINCVLEYYVNHIYPNLLKNKLFINYCLAKLKMYYASSGKYPTTFFYKQLYKLLIKTAVVEKKIVLMSKMNK